MTLLEKHPRQGVGWRRCALFGGALGLVLFGAVCAAQAQNAGGPEGAVSAQAQTGSIGPEK